MVSTQPLTSASPGTPRAHVASPGDTPWYFRRRSHIIIALVLFPLLWPWGRLPVDVASTVAGGVLVAVGVLLRLWCIRQVGGAARKRAIPKALQLVTWGPFAMARNPIYIANMLLFAGFTVLVGLAWAVPVLVGLMWLQYSFTVSFEERFLQERFGDVFCEYCRQTPRWIGLPRFRRPPDKFTPYPLRKLLRRERSLLLFQLPGGIVLIVAERALLASLYGS